ncbi:hypothetical protein [Streptomyces sp. NBC_00338]|uniref:hypothetical protein n=1 Tax=unclassified Streptomyces TaxID=2593676 RepID=UPI00225A0AA1|nr:hypothetical protein [Streptomyces sp. NBC_00338]MCX5142123.1 hypothetical protein [Streptomyces sp. NBC_00338]WSU60569.1 hypothetical protein OG450_23275 [Streptomyces sp. NBC_01104]
MIRNVLGSIVALLGAAAAVLSPFRDWYDGRLGRYYGVDDLFTGVTGAHPAVLGSILLPFLFAAVLAVVGVVLRFRPMVALAGVLVLGFTVLWMVRQGQAAGSLTIAGDGSGLQQGVAGAAGGGVLLLLGAALMSGRRGRPRRERVDRPYEAPGSADPDTWPPTREPGPSVQTSPWPEPEPDPYVGPPGPPSGPRDPASGPPRDPDSEPTATYPVQDPPDHPGPPGYPRG